MKERRFLDPTTTAEGRSVLVQASPVPVIRGSAPDGIDYVCGACRKTTLVEHSIEGQIWDIVFRCLSCDGLSASPTFPPGKPLARPLVTVPPGQYLMESTVDLALDVVMVGTAAVERRTRETGERVGEVNHLSVSFTVVDKSMLIALIEKVRRLLGSLYEDLVATDQRGRAAAKTPPRQRHRLMELVEGVQRAVAVFGTGRPLAIGDVESVAELAATLDLLERWSNDPAWPGILRSLKNAHDFPHAVATVAVASFMIDKGNGVGLHIEDTPGKRAADIRVAVGVRGRMGIEVKTPQTLQRPRTVLQMGDAHEVVKKALKSAGSGRGGQLSADQPGLLAVCGFYLRERDIDLLEKAASVLLRKSRESCTHIAGIAILSVGVLTIGNAPASGRKGVLANPFSGATITIRIAKNVDYTGSLKLVTGE